MHTLAVAGGRRPRSRKSMGYRRFAQAARRLSSSRCFWPQRQWSWPCDRTCCAGKGQLPGSSNSACGHFVRSSHFALLVTSARSASSRSLATRHSRALTLSCTLRFALSSPWAASLSHSNHDPHRPTCGADSEVDCSQVVTVSACLVQPSSEARCVRISKHCATKEDLTAMFTTTLGRALISSARAPSAPRTSARPPESASRRPRTRSQIARPRRRRGIVCRRE